MNSEQATVKILSLIDGLPKIRGSYRQDVVLSKINWFNVGGPAQVVYRPADEEDLAYLLSNIPSEVPITTLGVGSNLLVRDGGLDGIVIRLGKGFTEIQHIDHTTITAGAGALSYNVAHYAASQSITGLEFLCGIPGTIGGALAMNAGSYGQDVSSTLIKANAIDRLGKIHQLSPQDIGYVYRGNSLPDGMIFTKAFFSGTIGTQQDIQETMSNITSQREMTQPIKSKTSGSTFKNPPGNKAWKLIDQAGCRGLRVGGAMVSKQHCNFFINTGHATANDIETLGKEVRRRVLETTGISLEWEVKIIGKQL